MSLKIKILLLALLPLVLVTLTITMVVLEHAKSLSEEEIKTFEANLLASKRRELENYLSLALTSIQHIISDETLDENSAKRAIKQVLNGLTFGEDGYFFVYDQHGVNLVHPILPELVGQNLIDLQDRNGDYVIRNLLHQAEQGGGFHRYVWNKPSSRTQEDKLSYVVQIQRWRWMLGTGLYIDDIAREIDKTRKQVQINVRNTFLTVLAILSGTVVIVLLISVAINLHEARLASSRLQTLAHRSVRLQVSERRHFARELHDGISQMMVSVLYRMGAALSKLKTHKAAAEEDLHKGHRILKNAISEIRRISHDLRPSLLDDMGLKIALNSLLVEFSERSGIDIKIEYGLAQQQLPEDIEITFYRVAQEALTNVERHSAADHVIVQLWRRDTTIWLSIEDDGQGFDADAGIVDGIGVRNMRERVELLSGFFRLKTAPGKGTKITVGLQPMLQTETKGG